ncbi:MAG: amidohydrolase family protein [Dehalococcoidia bacterium]
MTRLIDVHRHLWDVGWFPPSHLQRIAETNAKATNRNPDDILEKVKRAKTMDPTGDGAVEEMEHFGIDVSIILALDYGLAYGDDSITPVEEFNRLTMEACKKYPGKLYAMCGFDPRRPNAVQMFDKAVKEWGAIGLKVYPPNGFAPEDPVAYPMYQKAVELDVPILIHTGGRDDRAKLWPQGVAKVAQDFPTLRILMGHVNLQSPFTTEAYWDGLEAAAPHSNIYLDLCDWQALGAVDEQNIPKLISVIRTFLDRVGPERICWGTDLPQAGLSSKQRRETEIWADIFKNLPEWGEKHGVAFTEHERDGICYRAAEACFSNIFAKSA